MTTSRSNVRSSLYKKVPKKPTRKKKAIPKSIREQTLAAFQKVRKMEEANGDGMVRCISCGKLMHWKESQGGHYIPRAVRATEIDPDNVWPQCPRCNGVLYGNLTDYRYRLVKRIGEERVQRLENLKAAYYGDEEAMSALSDRDQIEVLRKKGKVYYAERLEEIKKRLKELEG